MNLLALFLFTALVSFAAGILFRHLLPIVLAKYAPLPDGHHKVRRGGKEFVRRNPKSKQQQLPLDAAGE